jgi:hypothetical protein
MIKNAWIDPTETQGMVPIFKNPRKAKSNVLTFYSLPCHGLLSRTTKTQHDIVPILSHGTFVSSTFLARSSIYKAKRLTEQG